MSCYYACNKHAILFSQDIYGFVYPKIDESKCIDCGACDKNCPILNNSTTNVIKDVFGARIKNEDELVKSTSGGVATQIAKKILNENGVVYGVAYNDDNKVIYLRVDNISDLIRTQGTKYSEPQKDFWINLKEDIRSRKLILFSGTPCTVAAVKQVYQGYEKLICIEVVCHGITSSRVHDEYCNIQEKKHKSELSYINVRYKKNGVWDPPYLKTKYMNDDDEEEGFYFESMYGYAFLNMSRESCYLCKFKGENSNADITLGDCWGIDSNSSVYSKHGVSVLLIRTKKGKELIENENDLLLEKLDYNMVIKYNYPIVKCTEKNQDSKEFRNRYSKMKLKGACWRSKTFRIMKYNTSIRRIKRKIRSILKIR